MNKKSSKWVRHNQVSWSSFYSYHSAKLLKSRYLFGISKVQIFYKGLNRGFRGFNSPKLMDAGGGADFPNATAPVVGRVDFNEIFEKISDQLALSSILLI